MNFGDAQTYVMDRYAIQAGDTAKVTQIKALLVGTHARLVGKHALLEAVASIVVTGGTATATAPSDFIRPLYIRNGIIRVTPVDDVTFGDEEAVQAAGLTLSATGFPFTYSWRPPSTFQVWPTPTVNTTISVPYVQRPAAMSANGDAITGVPVEFHDLLCEYVCVRVGMSEGEWFEPQMSGAAADQLDAELTAYRAMQQGPVGNRIRMRVYG